MHALLSLLLLLALLIFPKQKEFDLHEITFKGIPLSTTKREVVKAFGKGEEANTDHECGFFGREESGGPFYKLVYPRFNYIGSDKGGFYLENVLFDKDGLSRVKYGKVELSGLTTNEQFAEIFGAAEASDASVQIRLLISKGSDDGARFHFENGRLVRFEYWTPC